MGRREIGARVLRCSLSGVWMQSAVSQCAQFLITADFCENTGKIWVLLWQKYGVYEFY